MAAYAPRLGIPQMVDWTKGVEQASPAASQYLVIGQGERYVGVAIDNIVEIIRMVALSSIPESSDKVAGVVNYRGDIIPIIDLWSLLGIATPPVTPDMGIVILSKDDEQFGLMAENVLDVRSLEVKPRPDELKDDVVWPIVSGVSYLDDEKGLLLVLNAERLKRQQASVAQSLRPAE